MTMSGWRLRLRPLSLAALRVAIVLIFLWHGVPKAFNPAAAMDKFKAAKGIQPGLERDVLILAGTVVLAAFGPGCCSIDERTTGTDTEPGASS